MTPLEVGLRVGDKLTAFCSGDSTYVDGEITEVMDSIGIYKVTWNDGVYSVIGFNVIDKYRRLYLAGNDR